ncbi:MAG: GIY-YIG nuclease family protein [Burkholderiales bacterium]
MTKTFYVYILTNKGNNVLYTGVTSDLKRRVFEHRHDFVKGFTKKYRVHKLVYYEIANDAYNAISREKQIKGGSRADKLKLVNGFNPEWRDLYEQL